MIKTYVAFDLETTGLSADEHEIIEFGGLKVVEGKVVSRFIQFVKPEYPISRRITSITGIDNDMVAGAPDIRDVMPVFLDFCGDLPLVGHNISFDYKFVKTNANALGYEFERSGIDTLAIARKVHKEMPSRNLGALCEKYGIENKSAHRAYHDALATAKLYQTLAHFFENEHPDIFKPRILGQKAKKIQPITGRQKVYLLELLKYHKMEFNREIDALSRSEASKIIDKIISEKGRMD